MKAPGAWDRVRELLARHLGLDFPAERLPELLRGFAAAARDAGLPDAGALAQRLLTAPVPQPTLLQQLARHLTIGETYFFRDPALMQALAREVLPSLIRERRGRDQRLRLWSAGCSSGEEPYTLAILLHQLLPDLAQWQVSILATDLNPTALHKAQEAAYGEWSFRNVPQAVRDRYFSKHHGRYVLDPQVRRLVRLEPLNLVDDAWPCVQQAQQPFDLVVCRNVLMYFRAQQARGVLVRLQDALAEGGWLALGPCEAQPAATPRLRTHHLAGALLQRKSSAGQTAAGVAAAMPLPRRPARPRTPLRPAPLPAPRRTDPAPAELSLLAHTLADQGRLDEALAACERWLRADKLDAGAHCLRGIILLEQAALEPARHALERALFLDPGLALGRHVLGDLARRQRREQA